MEALIFGVPESLLSRLQACGSSLDLDAGGELVIRAPKGALTEELRAAIRIFREPLTAMARRRAELLAEDRARGDAYEHGPEGEAYRRSVATYGASVRERAA